MAKPSPTVGSTSEPSVSSWTSKDAILYALGVGAELKVTALDGAPAGPGEEGELLVKGPMLFQGYLDDPEKTDEALSAEGWLHTGDLGRLRTDGNLVLSGRLKEMYIRGGYNVHPVEVESQLSQLPGVADAAVVGVADPVMGEIGVAFVVPSPGTTALDLATLRDQLSNRLARHQLPERLVLLDALPLTPADKVDRGALDLLAASPARGSEPAPALMPWRRE